MIVSFIHRAVMQGIPLLFGATGEIITEKSGNLNLGIPGVMYVGGISGVIGAFMYENSLPDKSMANPFLAIMIPLLCSLIGSLIMGLIYSFLTTTLRANQNVTGLAITTFGVGLGNFFGGSLIKIFLNYGFLAYLAVIIAIVASIYLKRTRSGLNLRAVGENPATADAAGVNVSRYKYLSTCIGSMIAGLGGLYYVMDYVSGVWSNDGFGDRGWLAIALVIFTVWKPNFAIIGSILFGGLYIVHNYLNQFFPFIPVDMGTQELIKMAPYVVTVLVLIFNSMRNKRENQPPEALGLSYFREDR